MSTTLVPLALPLSILLASIMTFGNMGENFELVAIKSSGISFLRFMQPLLIFIFFIAGLAFIFSNNVIPVANLKAFSLLYDVRNAKPTMNIKADKFSNDIPGYSIRVGSKDPDGNTIRDVLIYDHTDMMGNNKVILAKEGQMMPSPDKQSLIFRLKDGWRYEEGYTRGTNDLTQTRMHFDHWDKVFDLSALKFTRTNEDLFKQSDQMMNVSQLAAVMDSVKRTRNRTATTVGNYMAPYVVLSGSSRESGQLDSMVAKTTAAARKYTGTFLDLVPDSMRGQVAVNTLNNVRNLKSSLDITSVGRKLDEERYVKLDVEWHRKVALSFACVLLFLIGAPLGAIIRKGGLGMPLVIAVVFFMAFHILNITGEKLVKANSVPPWMGMWMSTGILLPLAFWLVKAARNDSQIFTKEWYIRLWRRVIKLIPVKKAALA
jgi:lipopolysaccharide export system permease protein